MVFNMFKGLSRLLSRKSAKTVVPPIVGFQSAEQSDSACLSSDLPDAVPIHQTLEIGQERPDSMRLVWTNKSGRYVTLFVNASGVSLTNAAIVSAALRDNSLIVSRDYQDRRVVYNPSTKTQYRVSELMQMLCDDGILYCVPGTIVPEYTLREGVTLL